MVKFLIIRFSSIGDIVLTTPVVRCLKQQVEDVEIHYLTKKQFAGIVSSNTFIDKVHLLEDNFGLMMQKLKAEEFDYVIDLHHNMRTWRVKRGLGVLSFSFNKLNLEKWLITSFLKINKLPDLHIVDRYLETIKLFDVKNDHKGLDFFIPDTDEVDIKTLPVQFHNGYIALVIGAKHATKQLPEKKIVELCNRILSPIILMGGPEDSEIGERIRIQSGEHVLNSCGKFKLNQSASLVRQSKLVITHDTGLMHIASAFHKQIISIWGNTIPEFGMYPYIPGSAFVTFETKDLKCRPCSKIGYKKCPKGDFKCMQQIDTDKIAEVAMTFLNN